MQIPHKIGQAGLYTWVLRLPFPEISNKIASPYPLPVPSSGRRKAGGIKVYIGFILRINFKVVSILFVFHWAG